MHGMTVKELEEFWWKRMEEVKSFRQEHGRWPNRRKSDYERRLYVWIRDQRRRFKADKLTFLQKEEVMMTFKLRTVRARSTETCIRDYQEDPNSVQSRRWVKSLRRRYKAGEMSESLIRRARKLGVDLDWEGPKGGTEELHRLRFDRAIEGMLPDWEIYRDPERRNFLPWNRKSLLQSKLNHWRQGFKKGILKDWQIEVLVQHGIIDYGKDNS